MGDGVVTLRLGVLTISDACFRGERADISGGAIVSWGAARGYTAAERGCVPDESARIVATLLEWADGDTVDLILTTGGTGLAPRDVTPEATRAVLVREAPGIAEALRAAASARFPRAALSRGTAGVRSRALIINLPAHPAGCATDWRPRADCRPPRRDRARRGGATTDDCSRRDHDGRSRDCRCRSIVPSRPRG